MNVSYLFFLLISYFNLPIVDTLRLPNFIGWNKNLVYLVFSPYVTSTICSIPLMSRDVKDKIFLLGNKNGYYYVKSKYHTTLHVFLIFNVVASFNLADTNWFCLKFWKLKLHDKVKNFRWRACNKSLPRICNLLIQEIISLTLCSL